MDKRRKVLLKLSETDTYKILEQSLKKKDKVSFIPLEEVRPYKDGNTYYIKDCMISANDLHELYMKLENSLLTVSEITDNGYYCKFKEVNNGTWFSSRIIRVITPAKENKLAERGDTIVVMKGSILPIGEQHTILDIVKLSTKRIYGVKTPHKENGMTYIDSKFCKLKKNEKELEKKVG